MVSTAEDASRFPNPVDLLDLARSVREGKPVWAHQSTDLSVNLIALIPGHGIANHVNTDVDVLLLGVDGTGVIEVDGRRHPVQAGQVLLIPKGSQRAIQCGDDHFAYLTCHRRRTALMPAAMSQGSRETE